MIDLERFFKPLRRAQLKDHERAQMRASLIAYMRENPLKPSAWRVFVTEMTYLTLSVRVHPVVTAFVLVLCVATGTSYAAETSLPGEPLYAIKTNVNEKAVGAFAVSHAAKVEWGARLADRRLSEAEELVSEGKLTPVAAASIQSGLADATKAYDDSIETENADQSDTKVSDAQSDMQASLQAHVHILTALQTASTTDSSSVSQILETVHNRAKGIADGRDRLRRSTVKDQSEKMRDAVAAKKQDAEDAVQTLRELATSAKDSFGTTTADDVTVGALQAADRVTVGTQRLDEGDYSGALGSYQAAIRAAKETKISLDAARHVRKNLRSHRDGKKKDSEDSIQRIPITAPSAQPDQEQSAVGDPTPQVVAPAATLMAAPSEDKIHGDKNENEDSDHDSVHVELHF